MLKFVGKPNEFVAGVPSKDLSAEEWAQLPSELQELALKSGLYQSTKEKPAQKAEE